MLLAACCLLLAACCLLLAACCLLLAACCLLLAACCLLLAACCLLLAAYSKTNKKILIVLKNKNKNGGKMSKALPLFKLSFLFVLSSYMKLLY